MTDIKRLRGLLAEHARLSDNDDLDQPERMTDVESILLDALPGLLDALEAAESRATRAAEDMREMAMRACSTVEAEWEGGTNEQRVARRIGALECRSRIRALPTQGKGT